MGRRGMESAIPQIEVRPAVHDTRWVITSWMGGPQLPEGALATARLMRSQHCVGHVRREQGILVLVPSAREDLS